MINLRIITPTGTYLVQSVDYLEVCAPHSVLGILPGHAPLISTLLIGLLKTKVGAKTNYYAAGEGVIHIKKDETIVMVSSIEKCDEIDIDRAIEAKKRAEQRLQKAKDDTDVDIARAESALSRALNRIKVYNEHK